MNTPAGIAMLERARALMVELKEMKTTAPDDAQAIADQMFLYLRQQFGSTALPDLSRA